MKNFKKALALVLAAATAFTFAPVANLGSAVEAEAKTADVIQTLPVPSAVYTTGNVTTTQAATETAPGYSSVAWARDKNGIVIRDFQVMTKSAAGNTFKVATAGDVTGYDSKEEKDASTANKNKNQIYTESEPAAAPTATDSGVWQYGASASVTGGKFFAKNLMIKSQSNKILDLGDLYISSKGSHTIELVDQNASDGETIRLTINAEGVKEQFPTVSIQPLQFYKSGVTTTIVADDQTSSHNQTWSPLNSQSSTYFLDLNKYNPGYMIEYKNNGTYTAAAGGSPASATQVAGDSLVYKNWAGQIIAISKIELTGSNRSIQWADPTKSVTDPLTYQRDTKVTLTPDKDLKFKNSPLTMNKGQTVRDDVNANYAIFKTTAPTVTTDSIGVKFYGDNSYDVNDSIVFSTDKSENAIDDISLADVVDGKYTTLKSTTSAILSANPDYKDAKYYVKGLDRRVHNSGTLKVTSETSNVTFKSASPSIVEIDEKTGKFTVKNKGVALINIYTLGSINNKDAVTTVAFDVNAYSTDAFDVKDSANAIYKYLGDGDYLLDMDVPAQKASNSLTTDTLQVKSLGGLKVKYTSSDTSVATVDETSGVITTKKEGTTTITAETQNDTTNDVEIWGAKVEIKVTVWTLPAVDYDVAPITIGVGEEKVVNPVFKDTTTNFTYSVNYNSSSKPDQYQLTNPNAARLATDLNTQTTSKVIGQKAGRSSLQVTVIGITGKYRPTTKVVAVNVTDKAAANVITVADDSKSVIMNIGDTKQLSATATLKNTVTFKSNNDAIVTATSGGAITAVSSGSTTITVSADGAESVEIPVIVNAKADNNADITVPGKVAKIKLYQVKGAKLKINYKKIKGVAGYKVVYKYKKNGKQVRKTYVTTAGSKTVSVPKNTSVKVWVRAYNVNAKGQRVNGAYKTATKKTDKK